MERPANLRAHVALLFMVVIWGINFSVGKIALEDLSPLTFNALRFPLGAALLYILLRRRGRIPLPAREDLGLVLMLGLLGNLLYQMFFIFGLDLTRAGNASLLLASTPIMTTLLSAWLGHERVKARVWLAVIATFAGILLVVLGGRSKPGVGGDTLLGDLIMFAASLAWSFYTVCSRPLLRKYGPLPLTAWTLWIGCAAIVLVGLPQTIQADLAAVPVLTWVAVAYAGILSIGVAYIIWYYGVEHLGNTRTAAYSNLTPVVALAFAWWSLGEIPTAAQLIGTVVILSGVTLAQSG